MHYYKKNIGDYHKKAGRLSMLEHGAYTLLMDSCYDREEFPTLERAYAWCWARTKAEKSAVEFVLDRFFKLKDGVYVQQRILDELESYQKNSETNKRIAIEREEKRRVKSNSSSTNRDKSVNEPPPNQEPLTINHKPITNKQSGRMARPTLEQLIEEFNGRVVSPLQEANKFLNHYNSNGWKVGKNPMKSWKAAVTNWITRGKENAKPNGNYQSRSDKLAESARFAGIGVETTGTTLDGSFEYSE